ncbi:asparagine synthase [Actinomadura logoneensis]|uniref:Asparagine synthase n=1 Tax=Actinomadura logoneensis TaxID=2293572 RepID=A0A372JQ53_9ACTN|nr:asparagine synthase [Actinomadura logoneensis]RFU41936.1 asparagine synthase [Actinomadura logoneensis]
MLKLRIDPNAVAWRWNGTAYVTPGGRSELAPFTHPLVEQVAATDGTRTAIIVRERAPGGATVSRDLVAVTADELDYITDQARRWPLDYVLIETAPHRPVRLTAGAVRSTPLFLAHQDGILHGSWDMADLQPYAGGLHPKEVTRMLVYRPRYSTDTAFAGIRRLTERATATFGGDLVIRYPEPVLHAAPRALAVGADVLAAFTAAIDMALDARPLDPDATLCHLTGGLDSGSIGIRAARRWPGRINTATLVIIGAGRNQQIRRRAEIRDKVPFGPHDLCLDTRDLPMFAPGCARVRGELVSPYDEPLHQHFVALNRQIAGLGAHTVVTGLGGDEMVAVGSAESAQAARDKREDFDLPWLGPRARAGIEYGDDGIAPPAMAGGITLLAAECVAPPLLQTGLWPVHPFAHQALVELGDRLPFYWRELKQLQRRHLATFGLSEDACNPKARESFAELVEESLMLHGIPLLRRILDEGSPLIEDGFLDPDGLKGMVAALESETYREDTHSKLVEVITLDAAARAFL